MGLCFNYQQKDALVICVDFEEFLNKNGISNQVTALNQETTIKRISNRHGKTPVKNHLIFHGRPES